MIEQIGVREFLELGQCYPIVDVRTPAEFDRGHIPGAANIPLFSNDERAIIGKTYKQVGRNEAMLLGLDATGPRMRSIIEAVQQISSDGTVLFHCWRGGMRSESVAWLAGLFGYKSYTLKGGYKAFRNYVLDIFKVPRQIYILGGGTGSGKTRILHEMQKQGAQIIDLEGVACHKGSTFGGLGQAGQPTQQQFENELALLWQQIDPDSPVWLEDESRHIGRLSLPLGLWQQMQTAFTLFIEVPVALRTHALIQEYGCHNQRELKEAIIRLQKRLGYLTTQRALEALEARDLTTCCQLLLRHYYDKTYNRSLARRDPQRVQFLKLDSADASENAERVLGMRFTAPAPKSPPFPHPLT